LNNLKVLLSQELTNSQNRPGSAELIKFANNNQRPLTSKVQNRIFETDSDFESECLTTNLKKDQNRFFAIMDEIENRNLIDEGEQIGVLKTLILEENRNIFKVIEN